MPRSFSEMSDIDPNLYYTIQEVSDIIGLTQSTIWYHIKTGNLKSMRVGKRHHVKGEDLLESFFKRK